MSEIERRALMKGAALSALAFTIGSSQVLLSRVRRAPRMFRSGP